MKLQLKRSQVLQDSTPGAVIPQPPTAPAMFEGELAVNYNSGDPALYIENADGSIVRLDGNTKTYSLGTNGTSIELTHNNIGTNTATVESLVNFVEGEGIDISGSGNSLTIAPDLESGDGITISSGTGNSLNIATNLVEGTGIVLTTDSGAVEIAVDDAVLQETNITISDTAPSPGTEIEGELWWNSSDGRLYIWYEDGNTNQWVDASPPAIIDIPEYDLQEVTDFGNTTTNNIVTSGDIQSTSQNGGPLAGFRNHIINGAVIVHQRSSGFVQAPDYGADRWRPYSNNSEMSRGRITDLPGFAWALTVRNTAGNTTGKSIRQCVELIDSVNTACAPFIKNAVYTHSFWAKQRSGAAVDIAEIGTSSITFADDSNNTNSSAAVSATAFTEIERVGNWKRFARQVTIDQDPTAGNLCLQINISMYSGTELSGSDGIYYTGMQFEPGPVATPFEHRPIGTELALCQRYFIRQDFGTKSAQKSVAFSTGNGQNQQMPFLYYFPVEMRAQPSADFSQLVVDSGSTQRTPSLSFTTTPTMRYIGASDLPPNTTGRLSVGGVLYLNAEL